MNKLNVSPKEACLRGTRPSYLAPAAHPADVLQDPAIEKRDSQRGATVVEDRVVVWTESFRSDVIS